MLTIRSSAQTILSSLTIAQTNSAQANAQSISAEFWSGSSSPHVESHVIPRVTPVRRPADPIDALREKIMGMARPARWNGPGSRAILKSACLAAVDFVIGVRDQVSGIPFPRVGPSQLGGVALQWRFGDIHYMVRISSKDLDNLYFQREGPAFQQECGTVSQARAIAELMSLANASGDKKL